MPKDDLEPAVAIPEKGRRGAGRGPSRRPVRVVRLQGRAALVEYAEGDMPARVTIPAEEVAEGGMVAAEVLEKGVPHGLPWEDAPVGKVTAKDIARALRNAGIWTAEDLRTRQREAVAALASAYRMDLGALNAFAARAAEED